MKALTNDPSMPPSIEIYGGGDAGAHALHVLISTVAHYGNPYLVQEVQSWAGKYIGQASVDVEIYHPADGDHKNYVLKNAFVKLGEYLSENANMYRGWEQTDKGFKYVAKCLYFKNDFGK